MHPKIFSSILFTLAFIFLNAFTYAPAQAQLQMPSFSNAGIQDKVLQYFADSPDMVAIAKCESGFRQFNNSGMPLSGGGSGAYVGVFQLSKNFAAPALALGFDIYSVDGNLGYARYMFQNQGTKPWVSCLSTPAVSPVVQATYTAGSSTPPSVSVALDGTIFSNLSMGMESPEVLTLQKLLNAGGFTLAASGPGSIGNETTRFGALTREAVKNFQCTKNIVCSGNETSTGFGFVGSRTRAALLSIAK